MRTVLVTGCAGFIGSHVAEACLAGGDRVLGVDSLNDYYDVARKLANVDLLQHLDGFEFVKADIAAAARELVDGVDVVFHEAGQPGVRESWREKFADYLSCNVAATQQLLEAALAARIPRVVFASSSSVYGDARGYPVDENELPRPLSPYGVTKLAAEHLCSVYAESFGLSVVSLRYFSVYGERQRPDMAIHRLIDSALSGLPFAQFGDGSQVRDFTFVSDVVNANLAAARGRRSRRVRRQRRRRNAVLTEGVDRDGEPHRRCAHNDRIAPTRSWRRAMHLRCDRPGAWGFRMGAGRDAVRRSGAPGRVAPVNG
jgi:UDP-glucuronate 4-epimerase